MPSFLIDECVSKQTTLVIEKVGYSVYKAESIGLKGAKDDVIFRIAQEKKAVLVTYDKGFADIRKYSPSDHAGIILIRVHDFISLKKCNEVLEILLKMEEKFKGTLFVVDREKYRKRTKP